MQVALKLRNHPSKQSLLAYAENGEDNRVAIDRSMAAHIVACPQCKTEVESIRASLSFVSSAPMLEPGTDLTARILMAGKSERSVQRKGRSPLRTVLKVAQVGACAAAMLVVTGLTFSAFLGSPENENVRPVFERSVPVVVSQGRSPEAMRQAAVDVAAEVVTLSAAVSGKQSVTPAAMEEMRVIQSRDDDIAAAVLALQRNPGSERAANVVHTTLTQQQKSLKNLFVKGGSL